MFEEEKNKNTKSQTQIKPEGVGSLTPEELKQIRGEETQAATNAQPLSKEFDTRMEKLHSKGKKRGKRYSWIGILASIIVSAAVLYFGYNLLKEVNNIVGEIDEKSGLNENELTQKEDPDNVCDKDYCCLASLKKINRGEYRQVESATDCEIGYVMKQLDCEGSLKWCEASSNEEEDVNIYKAVSLNEWLNYETEKYSFKYPPYWDIEESTDLTDSLINLIKFKNTNSQVDLTMSFYVMGTEEWYNQEVDSEYRERFHIPEENIRIRDVFSVNDITQGKLAGKSYDQMVCVETACQNIAYITSEFEDKLIVFEVAKNKEPLLRQILNTWQWQGEEVVERDSDGDGLTDTEEEKYGTSINNPDSDGDGFSDGEEVKNGFNPLGEGKL